MEGNKMKNADIIELFRVIRSNLSGDLCEQLFQDDGHLFRKYHEKGLDFIYDLDTNNLNLLFNWAKEKMNEGEKNDNNQTQKNR